MGTATVSGGAGVHMIIAGSGDMTVDYNGMQPLEVRLGSGARGTGVLTGVGRAVITAREGALTPSSYDGSGVSISAVVRSSDGVEIPITLPLRDVFGVIPENYRCSGGSVTLIRPAPLPDLVFQRQ